MKLQRSMLSGELNRVACILKEHVSNLGFESSCRICPDFDPS